jgi:hypothetical protein
MRRFSPLLVVVALLALNASVTAQTSTATIVGVTKDTTGAVLEGVTVRIVNEGTSVERVVATSRQGLYEVSLLPPGQYTVEGQIKGFKKTMRPGIELQVNQRVAIDLVLEIGPMTDEVTVRTTAASLDTQSATVGTVIDNRQIVGLPLNGRDFFLLSSLVPGALPAAEGSQNGTQGGAVAINGAREQSNNFLLDGVDNNSLAINQIVVRPSADAVEEFKVQSSTYNAEFGRSGGGQFNYVTKSGTNFLSGSAYDFFRNSALDAKNFFDDRNRPIPEFVRHQGGVTFGGPLRRNKLFFFGSYERLQYRQAFTRVATVPPTAWINGNFSNLLTGVKDPKTGFDTGQLFDPRTSQPIQGNIITPALQDAAGANILKFYPAPDDPTATGPSGATVAPIGTNHINQTTGRVDWNAGAGEHVFGRYAYWNEDRFNPFDPLTDPTNVPGFGSTAMNRGHNLAVGWTRTVGSRAINELTFGFNAYRLAIFQEHLGNNINGSLGIGGVLTNPIDFGRPSVILGITDALSDDVGTPQDLRDRTFQVVDGFSWIAGRHSFKVGGEVRRYTIASFFDAFARGQFIFSGLSGNPVADLLLGVPTVALRQNPSASDLYHFRTMSFATYLQDDWRAAENLTFNIGVRYEYNQPVVEAQNHLSIPDYTGQFGGGFVPVGTHGVPLAGYNADGDNVAPRVGFAWRPGGSLRTVVRGGYGIYFDINFVNFNLGLAQNPPYYSLDLVPSPPGLTNAFSGQTAPVTFVNSVGPNFREGVYQHWSLGVQRELPGHMVIEIAYVGSKGTSLAQTLDTNQGQPGGPLVANPNFGPAFGVLSTGYSNFHSAQVRVERRLASGLSFLTSYTWSRSRDTASAFAGSHASNAIAQNSHDVSTDYGPSDFDTPHRLAVSAIWELPVGGGRRLLNDGGLAAAVLGGWQIAAVAQFQSGRPFTAFYGASANFSGTDNGANGGFGFDRPNLVGNPVVAHPTPGMWFNTAAFAPPNNAFGSVGRNTLRADPFSSIDVAFSRSLNLAARRQLQLRVDVFNLLNTNNFFLPIGDLTKASAGQVVRAYDARQVQLGLRFTF